MNKQSFATILSHYAMTNATKSLSTIDVNLSTHRPLFSRFSVVALVIGMVITFFVSQLFGIYIAGKWLLPAADTLAVSDILFLGSTDGTIVSLSIMMSGVILILFSVLLIRLKGGNVQRYLALNSFSLTIAMAMIGVMLLFMIGSQALTYWLDETPLDFVDPLFQTVSSVWLLLVAMVIIAPIYEELIFRGLLWSAITEQFAGQRGTVIASIVTSIIFASIHLQYGIYEVSTIVVLALIFCYARVKSGSLLLPIVLHILNNGVAMCQYLWQVV